MRVLFLMLNLLNFYALKGVADSRDRVLVMISKP
jgi:hypothetical protein